MPIQIIVEDGSNIPNANSYVSVADAKQYFTNRGLDIGSVTDDQLAAGLINAMDYLSGLNWIGVPQYTDPAQSLDWPRIRTPGCYTGPSNVPAGIPKNLKDAQSRLAFDWSVNNVDFFPVDTGEAFVTEETVGPLTTKYSAPVDWEGTPSMPLIDKLLEPLLCVSSAFQFVAYRG